MAWDGSLKRKSDRRSDEIPDVKVSLSIIGESLKNIETIQERHSHILFGRDEGKGGLILDVDRLKEHRKDTERSAYVIFTTAIGLIGKIIWDAIFHK